MNNQLCEKVFNRLIVAVYSAKKSIERRIKETSKVARILYKSDKVLLRFFFYITQAFSQSHMVINID